jgi:hypothetical protein
MAVYWSFALWVGFMGGALALLGGCSASTGNDDLFAQTQTSPTDPPPKDPPQSCPSIQIVCQPDEATYFSEATCRADHTTCRFYGGGCAGSVWCGKTTVQCEAIPTCDADDEETTTCPKGASCYSRTVCGSTILCQRPIAQCNAYPSCDPGDPQVVEIDTCKKAGVSCYSRTLCGTTIWCVDKI